MIFILPTGMDYRARRYPVVTFTLMGLCVLIYLIGLGFLLLGDAEASQSWIYENLWLIPDESHWWTYLTHQFVHGGLLHLVGNMIYLFLFGACVEDMIGRLRFTLFYLLCGLCAAFAHVLFSQGHLNSAIPMGGASGAISGCIGGYLILRAKAKIEFKWIIFFWFRIWNGEFQLPAWVVISFWFLEDFIVMIIKALADQHGGGVAVAAHVGGTLAGMGLMALTKLTLKPEAEDEEVAAPARVAAMARPVARMRVGPRMPAATPVENQTIFLFLDGAQSGPFTVSQIQRKFVAGEMPADAVYWQEGMTDWRTVEELREPGVM